MRQILLASKTELAELEAATEAKRQATEQERLVTLAEVEDLKLLKSSLQEHVQQLVQKVPTHLTVSKLPEHSLLISQF